MADPRVQVQESGSALNWYALFKASGLALDDTGGDGVGRFTDQDKAKIMGALWDRADALAGASR